MKLIEYLDPQCASPWYMGLAYYDPKRGCGRVVAIIPLNMIIYFTRRLWDWARYCRDQSPFRDPNVRKLININDQLLEI